MPREGAKGDQGIGNPVQHEREVRTIDFDDPRGIELGQEYVKLVTREMPTIPLMSYNVFTVTDDTYWTGYPTVADPYTNPVPNWANTKYMFVKLRPRKLAQN
jgi:peptide/nickel transport system substrate-binding protein